MDWGGEDRGEDGDGVELARPARWMEFRCSEARIEPFGPMSQQEIKTVELSKPVGWVHISLSGSDPRETFIHTFMLQIAVLSNHLNGRDTHIRQIKIYGPRPNPVPHQPFHFTSREFISYSTVR